jgi:hypothetical protein
VLDMGVPFAAILSTLVEEHAPVVKGAIFCDEEGEKVDAFSIAGVDAFDLDLLGAACAPVASTLRAGAAVRMLLDDRAVWLCNVDGGYYLLVLADRSRDGIIRFDMLRAVAALAAHM